MANSSQGPSQDLPASATSDGATSAETAPARGEQQDDEIDIDWLLNPSGDWRRRRTGETDIAYRKRRRESAVAGQRQRRGTLDQHINELRGIVSSSIKRKDKGSVLQGAAQLLHNEIDECPAASPRGEVTVLSPQACKALNATWRSIQVGLFFTHANLDSLDANPFLLQQLGGYNPFEIPNAWNILSPDTTEKATNQVGKILTGQVTHLCLQGMLRGKNEDFGWWNGCVTTVKKEGIIYIFGWMVPCAGSLTQEELDKNACQLPKELSATMPGASLDKIADGFAYARKWCRCNRDPLHNVVIRSPHCPYCSHKDNNKIESNPTKEDK